MNIESRLNGFKMNKILIVLFLSLCGLLQSCGIIIPQKRSWDFVQAVGGIKVDSIVMQQNSFLLYSNVNVSGLDSITTTPQQLNSLIACSKIYTKVNETEAKIYIGVGVSHSGIGYSCYKCRPEKIRTLKQKEYEIYYRDLDGKDYFIQNIRLE